MKKIILIFVLTWVSILGIVGLDEWYQTSGCPVDYTETYFEETEDEPEYI